MLSISIALPRCVTCRIGSISSKLQACRRTHIPISVCLLVFIVKTVQSVCILFRHTMRILYKLYTVGSLYRLKS